MASLAGPVNVGPLTTPFVYPSSCTSAFLNFELCTIAAQAQACRSKSFGDDPQCWPPSTHQSTSSPVSFSFYSPGISCPVGYTSACWATNGVSAGFVFDIPPKESETAVGCCPSGFSCSSLFAWDIYHGSKYSQTITDSSSAMQACISIARYTSYEALNCISGTINSTNRTIPGYVTVTSTLVTWSTITSTREFITDDIVASVATDVIKSPYTNYATADKWIPSVSVVAPFLQLLHQATDLSDRPSTGTETTTQVHDSDSGSSLSTGAKAGIGVGVSVLALCLIGAAFLFLRRRHRHGNASDNQPSVPSGRDSYVEPREGTYELQFNREILELPAKAETQTTEPSKELETAKEEAIVHELPG